jgi:truncated hemoglobin YjbI
MHATNNDASLEDKLTFYRLNPAAVERMKQFKPLLEANIDRILASFYGYVGQYPTLVQKFPKGYMDHAKKRQAEHWRLLFSGNFDENYVETVKKVGKAHQVVGLTPLWYMGGYTYVLADLSALIFEQKKWKPDEKLAILQAVQSAAMFDMGIVMENYNDNVRQAEMESFTQNAMGKIQGNVHKISEASERSSSEIRQVSVSMDQMSEAMNEVARNAGQAAQVASQANQVAETTRGTIDELGSSAREIGTVIDLIKGIAAQTNLLALNATIEAARAGEAGKGFAVVANEVKALARQSADATEEIRNRVDLIQRQTQDAVSAIGDIVQVISEMSHYNNSIAGAVEEQSSVTGEISRSISGVAQAAEEVGRSVEEMNQTAEEVVRWMHTDTGGGKSNPHGHHNGHGHHGNGHNGNGHHGGGGYHPGMPMSHPPVGTGSRH